MNMGSKSGLRENDQHGLRATVNQTVDFFNLCGEATYQIMAKVPAYS